MPKKMDYELADLLDIPLIQNLQEKLNRMYSFPSAIIDNQGRILTAVAWQDICTKFHRTHPQCEKECIKSDLYILEHIHEANPAISYQCPHGLVDNAVPIIIDGKHLGNFFTGQFFHVVPDLEFFRKQAKTYGFNEKEYLDAVVQVPVWTKEKLLQYIDFIKGFIEIIASIGLKNQKEMEINIALKNSEIYNNQLFDASPDGLVIIGMDGCIVRANKAQVKMYGYEYPSDMVGIHATQLVDSSSRVLSDQILNRRLGGEYIPAIEYELVKKDGTTFYGETLAANLMDVDGTLTGYICVTRDVTDRKNGELELIKAKEKAEESDHLKSAFLANMSHEIRTPMNGILGFTTLLKEPNLSIQEQMEYISIIEKSGRRLLNIINDIISISKVESGQMEVSVSEINMNQHLEYIYKFFKPEADNLGLQLIFRNSIPDSESIIRTDSEKVYAILTNLVKNALKFTIKGSIEIGCNLKRLYSKGDITSTVPSSEMEFFVKDTGVGIGKEQLGIIFERFRQGSESLNRNYEGAGLGLAISKAYVEILGGRIWVESTLGKGSVFYFTLPIEVEHENPLAIPLGGSYLPPKSQLKPIKILIAEDDEASEKYLTRIVRIFGREIITVRTGREAVEACRNNPDIDLVLMDIKMPEMDGYEATRLIRKFNTRVIIIAQTAFALSGDHEKALEAGCNDSIAKPIQKDKLAMLIKKIFDPKV